MVYLVLQTDTHEAVEPLCEFGAVAVERRDFNNLGPLNGFVESGFYETVERPQIVEVTALDRDGAEFTERLDGLMGICLQHEIDHLEGKLFVDYLSPLKRQRIRSKLVKEQKRRA